MPSLFLGIIVLIGYLLFIGGLISAAEEYGEDRRKCLKFAFINLAVVATSILWMSLAWASVEKDCLLTPVQTIKNSDNSTIQIVCINGTILNANELCQRSFADGDMVQVWKWKDYSLGISWENNTYHIESKGK